ncbi:hypothetical protein ACA910_018713 [Epithemia clementina (nom. ined.)]
MARNDGGHPDDNSRRSHDDDKVPFSTSSTTTPQSPPGSTTTSTTTNRKRKLNWIVTLQVALVVLTAGTALSIYQQQERGIVLVSTNPNNNHHHHHHHHHPMKKTTTMTTTRTTDQHATANTKITRDRSVVRSSLSRMTFWKNQGPKAMRTHSSSDNKGDNPNYPPLAWILSIGGTGTSYTLHNIEALTNTTTATNYVEYQGVCQSVLTTGGGATAATGPCWHRPVDRTLPIPSSRGENNNNNNHDDDTIWIATKTHCAAYCMQCPPRQYVIRSTSDFLRACRSGAVRTSHDQDESSTPRATTTTTTTTTMFLYPSNLAVQKAIHLIRNPFDNLVARWHLSQKLEIKRWRSSPSTFSTTSRSTTDRNRHHFGSSFAGWCRALDAKAAREELAADSMLPPDFVDRYQAVPCHVEWFRYIQWHNMAYWMTTQQLQIPVHYLYYEQLGAAGRANNSTQTLEQVLAFLGFASNHQTPNQQTQDPRQGASSSSSLSTTPALRGNTTATRLTTPSSSSSPITVDWSKRIPFQTRQQSKASNTNTNYKNKNNPNPNMLLFDDYHSMMAMFMVRELALDPVWDLIRHYFSNDYTAFTTDPTWKYRLWPDFVLPLPPTIRSTQQEQSIKSTTN